MFKNAFVTVPGYLINSKKKKEKKEVIKIVKIIKILLNKLPLKDLFTFK